MVNMSSCLIQAIGSIVVAIITGLCLIKVAQLKTHINSRMDDLLKLTSDSSFAKGKLEGESDKRNEKSI